MPWQPALGTQPLAPFDHQVAGQSSMLRYDKTTVCKPLIAREHFVYKTLPPELMEFTPEYRGEIEVQLIEEDGYIQLYGLCVDEDASECPCGSIPGHHSHEPLEVRPKVISKEASVKNRSTIRVLRSGSYEVSPSTDEVFYTTGSNPDHPHTHSLNPWSLKNHKRLLDKMRKSEHSDNKIRFILLKNVVADFRHPCILDLKIGSRLHGDDASSVKVASQSEKCRRTTSSTLGVRLCGMQVYQVESSAYHSIDKYHGRTLDNESFRDMLFNFLHNGAEFRSELIQPIVSRLSQLIDCLEKLHSFRFYASSLLIIYDGDVSVSVGKQEAKIIGSESHITVDMTPVKTIQKHPQSSQELYQSDGHKQSEEHVHLSNELCKSLEEQSLEYLDSLNEMPQSVEKQLNNVDSEHCSVSYSAALQSSSLSLGKQPQPSPNICGSSSGNDLNKVQTLSLANASTNPYDASTLNEAIAESLHQKISQIPVKNDVLGKNCISLSQCIETAETSNLLNNHVIQRGSDISSSSTKADHVSLRDVSVHDRHYSEPQTVHLDLQKLVVKADSSMCIQPSSISSVNSMQVQSHTQNSEHSVVLTRIQEQSADRLYCSHSYGGNLGPVDQNHSLVDSDHHERTTLKQGSHSVDSRHHVNVPLSDFSEIPIKAKLFQQDHSMTKLLPQSSNYCRNSVKVDVKMIDFAHTTHKGFTVDKVKHAGPDADYILGLRNLMKLFQELQGRE